MQNHSDSQREAPKDISGIKESLKAVNDICKRYAEHIIHGHKEDEMALHPKPSKEATIDALHQFRLAVGENFSNLSSQDISEIQEFLGEFSLYFTDSEDDTGEGMRIIKDISSMLEKREEKPTERKKIKTLLSPTESWAQTFMEELKTLEKGAQGDLKHLKITPDSSAYKTLSGILKLGVFSEMNMDTFFNCQVAVQNFRAKMGNGAEVSGGHFVSFEALLRNLELKMSFWLNNRILKDGIMKSTSRLQN